MRLKWSWFASLAPVPLLLAAGMAHGQAPAAPARGAQVFVQRCAVCHAVGGKGGKVGPDLTGVVGRKPAATGYSYSAALKKLGGTWTPAQLDKFLAAPSRAAPGTRMTAALANAEDRKAVIAYLGARR